MLSLSDIESAAATLQGKVRRTELIHSHFFSEQLDTPVFFKCENLQRAGSFKIRGATNFLAGQAKESLARGVITASAGNHAQGVALSASQHGIPSWVVMPESTPLAKVLATRDYGAHIELHGSTFDDAAAHAQALCREKELLYIPAFDHPLIMAGQGTVGLEILADLPDPDTVVVPIGGGGLISGIATAIKAYRPQARIIGVEAANAPSAQLALRKGAPVTLPAAHSLADGIAIKRIGDLTFPVIQQLVDEIVTVEEEDIAQAIVSLMEKGKLVTEGAGAIGLAALLYGRKPLHQGKTVFVLSGGNIDVQTMSRVVERGLVAEGRFLKIRVTLLDAPGTLSRLTTILADLRANVFHINHDRRNASIPLERTEVDLHLETRGCEHIQEILEHLKAEGYDVDVIR